MVKLLSANNPSFLFLAVILSILLHAIAFINPIDLSFIYAHTEPASLFLFKAIKLGTDSTTYGLLLALGTGIQIIMAWLINDIINQQKVTSKKTYFFSILFVLVSSFSRSWLILSPQLIVAFLSLIGIHRIFTLAKQEKQYTPLFDLGFIYSLSFLFYFPSVVILFFVLPSLYSIRPFSVVEFMRIVVGFFTPLLIGFGYYFLTDDTMRLFQLIPNGENSFFLYKSYFSTEIIGVGVGCLTWLIISGMSFSIFPFSINIKARKMVGTVGLLELFWGLSLFIPTNYHIALLCIISPILSFLLGMVILEFNHRFIPNVIFALLVISNLITIIFNL